MYRIYCGEELLYDPRDEELRILSGKTSLTVNTTGEFVFSLPPVHPKLGIIHKLTSVIRVYDEEEQLYEGRVLNTKTDMYHTVTYTCEGALAYLLDSIQRPKTYQNLTPRSYLQDKLEQHNSQVGVEKRFVLGAVEKQSMNYDAREDNQYTNTLDTIMDKLIKSNGGYLRVRKEDGIRYLDYLESYGRTSNQTIRFGENILDLTEHINAGNIITVLIPLGKAPEGSPDGAKLTIASVNGGKDYLEDTEASALYGRITGTNEWQDVTVPANLKEKGLEYLKNACNLAVTIELTAVDLHLVDVDIDRIKLGDMVRVVSEPHGLDRMMFVSKREYNLLNPSEDKIVLGETLSTLTEKQAAMQKEVGKQKNAAVLAEEVRSSVVLLTEKVGTAEQEMTQIGEKVQILETDTSGISWTVQELAGTAAELGETDAQIKKDIQSILERLEALEGRQD